MFSNTLYSGKVILITGGSRGGMLKETAKQYLLHGARVVVLMSRSKEKNDAVCKELSQYGPCVSRPGDVAKMDSCREVCNAVVQEFGQIDLLVNGAAGNFLATAEKISHNGVKRVLEIDTLGTFNMCQSVFKASMKERRSGVIINISATLHWNGSWGQVHSSAAKAGVDAITKVLATEWGPYGIRVCGLVPGPIEGTEGFERLGDLNNLNNKERTNKSFEAGSTSANPALDQMKAMIPAQRFGAVHDIANAALFLGSPAASYITGTDLLVDGGNNLTCPNSVFGSPAFVKMWSQAKL